ncbi:ExeM/NucH family extracellular endonuclease [Pseudooceanicola onchidii]|uniref:ExeM/NucH family extracellular endonuclease n=1 Tax=Pseudooceanicola onchidii TaxID=2562279 RepID=UPI0010AB13EE|nr:ExeM/NucH family extracellular endonuclease [Pseudooceanicola onchidii]
MSVRINEISVSTTSVDVEFIEFFGEPGESLDGLTLIRLSGTGTVMAAFDLAGRIGANGYHLIANSETEADFGVTANQSIALNALSNSSASFLLVRDFTGSIGDDLDPNDDGVIDFIRWSELADGVAVIDDDAPRVYTPNVIGPDGSFLAPGGYRPTPASDSFVMHDFADFSQYTPTAGTEVMINEISISTTGTDREFVEFLALPGTDLTSYSLIAVDGNGEIRTVLDLEGSAGTGNGKYLVANGVTQGNFNVQADQTIPDNFFTNASRSYLLVQNFSGAVGDDIDANDDGTIDAMPWTKVSDSVAVVSGDTPLVYSPNVVGPDGPFLAAGGYRNHAGDGSFQMHAFSDFSNYTPEAGSPVYISEISVSTTGTDAEFIELRGAADLDLSTASLIVLASGGQVARQIDLSGTIGSNGYFLLASPQTEGLFGVTADQGMANNTLTNASRTYLLVDGFTGSSGDDLDTTDDGILDVGAWSRLYDSVAVVDDDAPVTYSPNIVGPDGAFLAAGGYRTLNGLGSFEMHDFSDFSLYTPTSGQVTTQLVINEISVSTTGTDREFIEFAGDAGLDLSNYTLLRLDGTGLIRSAIDLTGRVGDNGYYLVSSPQAISTLGVIGNQLIPDNSFANFSATYLLVEGFTGAVDDDVDTDDDGIIDAAVWTDIQDSVAVIDDDSPLVYSSNVVGPDGNFLAAGGYRSPDIVGGFVMHAFGDFSDYTPTAGTYAAPVVINELVVSTTGTDAEFIELLGDANVNISDLSILTIDGTGEIRTVLDLEGQTGDNGYYILASPEAEAQFGVTPNAAIANNTFSNGSRTYLLVEDFTGTVGDDIDVNDDGVADACPWASIWDGVAVIDDDLPGIYTNNVIGPDGTFLAAGGYRNPERTGDFVMHHFGSFVAYTPVSGTGDTIGDGGVGETPAELLISDVQGAGTASTLVGDLVAIEAIVVGDFQDGDADTLRDLGGFFLQEEAVDHDGNALTSEGIFVFDRTIFGPDVQLGDRVRVVGTVEEFFGETQIRASTVQVLDAGAVADVNTMAVSLSLDTIDGVIVDGAGNYAPDMEAWEGMLATFSDTLTVNEMFQLDRFNEIRLSANGRPEHFTQFADPDPAAFDAYQRTTASDQIIFDDGLDVQNAPILPEADLNGDGVFDTSDGFTMGDTITGLTGVVTYSSAGNSASAESWRVRSVDDGNVFEDTAPRQPTPPDIGGSLTIASFNVLNFFTTLDVSGNPGSGPSSLDPRGADTAAEFDRQIDKLLTTLVDMQADVFGLVELENEFGYDQNGDGFVALSFLVDELNARLGSVTYAAVDPGRGFVDTGDAISVGMIYNVNTVALVADSVHILDDSVVATLSGSYPASLFDGTDTNRAPLAATFVDLASSEDFTVSVVHMKSKGGSGLGDDADQGDGAGAFNATRTAGVEATQEWLSTFADEDLIVIGDFNAYAQEDPIDAMAAGGFTNLGETYSPGETSYVFDGKTGTLDYAFGSAGVLDNVTGAATWSINASEPDAIDYNLDFGRDPAIFDGLTPYRTSDHDPILVGLEFAPTFNLVAGTDRGGLTYGTDGRDWIDVGGGLGDIIFGLAGDDVFDFTANMSNGLRDTTTIRDFAAADAIFGFEYADIDLATLTNDGSLIRFAYGPDGDVLNLLGELPADETALFWHLA